MSSWATGLGDPARKNTYGSNAATDHPLMGSRTKGNRNKLLALVEIPVQLPQVSVALKGEALAQLPRANLGALA